MPLTKEAFPRPKLENDDSYLGNLRASKKLQFKKSTPPAQQQDPWTRLYSTATVTSMKREAYLINYKIPKDNLDFRLATLYNHHTGTFKNKCEILEHKETNREIHRSKIKFPGEHLHLASPSPLTSLAHIRQWINPKKESIHSIQGSIVSHHTAATNRGYSRKNDGGFFST